MKTIEEVLKEENLDLEVFGWTTFNNEEYPDMCDDINKYRKFVKDEIGLTGDVYYDPPEKQAYCEELGKMCQYSEMVVADYCKKKGIKFDGYYHQNGDYGTPLIKTKYGIFRWTCSFRFWGGVMHLAGFGESYIDWAWQAPEESVTPDKIDGENLVNDTRG